VHLNYPEITATTIASGINNLSSIEKETLTKNLLSSMPHIRKALGHNVAEALEGVVKNRAGVVANATHPHKPHSTASVGQLHHRKFYFAAENHHGKYLNASHVVKVR
jgi:hypothetical protein